MDLYLGQRLTILPTQTNNYYLSCLLESLRYFWFISHGVNTLWLLCCFDDSEHKLRCVHACTRVWFTKNKTSVFLQGPFLYHNLTNTSTNKSATLKKHFSALLCSDWDYFFHSCNFLQIRSFSDAKYSLWLFFPTKEFFLLPFRSWSAVDEVLVDSLFAPPLLR